MYWNPVLMKRMTKGDFKAENVNTFRRNDYLDSFKLDNGTGMSKKLFVDVRSKGFNHYNEFTLDNPRHVQELEMDLGMIKKRVQDKAMDKGISDDVAKKIADRVSTEYYKSAMRGSLRSVRDQHLAKVKQNLGEIAKLEKGTKGYEKMANSYIKWATRENKKLHTRRNMEDAKRIIIQKLDKLKPSDIKSEKMSDM